MSQREKIAFVIDPVAFEGDNPYARDLERISRAGDAADRIIAEHIAPLIAERDKLVGLNEVLVAERERERDQLRREVEAATFANKIEADHLPDRIEKAFGRIKAERDRLRADLDDAKTEIEDYHKGWRPSSLIKMERQRKALIKARKRIAELESKA